MKLKLTIVLFFLPFLGMANDSLNYSNQRMTIGLRTQVLNYNPYLGLQIGRHQLSIGAFINNPAQYNLIFSGSGGYSISLFTPNKYKVTGVSLNYRIFPFKPQKIVSFYAENCLIYSQNNFFVNNTFFQKNRTLEESLLIGIEIKFLNRLSFWFSTGPAIDFNFGKEREIKVNESTNYIIYDHIEASYKFYLGFQIGIF